jgi:hypothetical protein
LCVELGRWVEVDELSGELVSGSASVDVGVGVSASVGGILVGKWWGEALWLLIFLVSSSGERKPWGSNSWQWRFSSGC